MPSKQKKKSARIESAERTVELPFSLYLSFAEIAGVSLKPCGLDGQLLPDSPDFPTAGPCGVLCDGRAFCAACADNHAKIIATTLELRRPYIFNCHMRLAAWAVPILHDGAPLPAAIICGGALLREPDAALISHMERAAVEQGVDPDELVRSLETAPVLSRDRIRAIADFLFQMSAALTTVGPEADETQSAVPQDVLGVAFPIVFPPAKRKETKKAKVARARALQRQSVEAEIVRLLRERRPDAALDLLIELLTGDGGAAFGGSVATNLNSAETFTRLFRMLAKGVRIPKDVSDKQSLLIAETLSQKSASKSREVAERSCREFISIAEQMTGEPRPRRVKTIQRFLEKNIARKLTLGGVGKKFGLKEKALDALMRKHFGMGFTDYVTSLRISEAKRLLLSTDLNMGEIARQTGFKDQSYFTKVFKSRIGTTPTEFRTTKRRQG